MLLAAIEAGGTKFALGLLESRGDGASLEAAPAIIETARIPTGYPDETVRAVADWFAGAFGRYGRAERLGVASFGPLSGRFGQASWGKLGPTPKPGWAGFDLPGELRSRLGLDPAVDTDVNAAALAEGLWGASRGLSDHVYVTVGTGVGGGVVSNGKLLHGAGHPETGHVPVPREPGDGYPGRCPFHGCCLEGMASGPAVAERWGAPAESLPPDHPAWDLEARYLASGFVPLVLALATERIVLGGGLGSAPGLAERVRVRLAERLAGYAPRLDEPGAMDAFVVPPGLGGHAGLLGAAALALGAE
ncbi:MAG: ROK family protein [Spirochaetes bacterium]|nr:ROK family protein [Spirochaetota bacterium]MBU1080257.1 ROK family protein [Spirochaetota bacterium]